MPDRVIGYEIFKKRILLEGTVTLLSGLHIGAGRALGISASDLPVLKDSEGRPFIPGSSLKGVLRSNLEAFLRAFQDGSQAYLSCCWVGGDASSDDPTLRPCIDKKEKQEIITQHRDNPVQADRLLWERSCWVCRFFGSPWVASKVQVLDLPVASAWRAELLSVRDGVAIDRESETAAPRLKYDFEVVPPGTRFRLRMAIENPDDYELGMLAFGLDLLNDGLALLGGHTSRGLGRVRIEIEAIQTITPQALLDQLRRRETPQEPLKTPERASPSGEGESKGDDEAQQAVFRCLRERGALHRDDLIKALQQQGWTKARLRELRYDNWSELFEKAVRAGVIAKTGERFHPPGAPQPALTDRSGTTTSPGGEEPRPPRAMEELEQWKEKFYQKLQEALEGKPCSESSTTRPESSTGSNR